MIVLIDGDIVAYRCAASAENEPDWVATARVNNLIHTIIHETGSSNYKVFISGQDNFRKTLSPDYKANRTAAKPKWLEVCREHLVVEWEATVTDNIEADDAIGIFSQQQTTETIMASLDKDFRQIPGKHYKWAFAGTTHGKHWERPSEIFEVSEIEAIKFFYKQLLIGDEADNITGVYGVGKVKASRLIDPCETEKEMFNVVRAQYDDDARLLMNGKLLWILKKEGEEWQFPNDDEEQNQDTEVS